MRLLLLSVIGCFGVVGVTWAQTAFDPEKAYTISLNTSKSDIAPATTYLCDDGSSIVKVADFMPNASFQWAFEPGEEEGTYYVRNLQTNLYLQSSKADANSSTKIKMGADPVAYVVAQDETSGAQTKGHYYLCSADQTIDNSTDGTTGLNYQNGTKSVVCYWIKTGRGNSYWDIQEFDGEVSGPVIATEPFTEDKYYIINRMNVEAAHMMETNDGKLSTSAFVNTARVYWKLIPTANEGCYYVQNAVTGRYIQSSKQALSSQIPMGSNPVEFKIAKDLTSGANTNGFYYFCSTDQTNIPAGAIGLNYDGNASKNVVAWYAKSGDMNSYWRIRETEFDYEPQILPLVESMDEVASAGKYALAAADGRWMTTENGTITLTDKGTDSRFAWCFVGTSNKNEGIYMVNMANPDQVLTYNADGSYGFAEPESGTRWFAAEKEASDGSTTLTFVPYDQKDATDAAFLTVDGVAEFVLANYRSGYSLATQIYFLPCGTLDEGYLTSLNVAGEQVQKELNYSGSKPSDYYTLYTVEKATVSRGETFNLTATMAGMSEETTAYVYFDWNRDGLFETMRTYQGGQIEDEINVPEDAVVGKSRMRVRITNNALEDAEDDAVGSIYDFIVNIAEPQAKRQISVRPNATDRGTAMILVGTDEMTDYEANYGETLTVIAAPLNDLQFVCWKDNRTVVSTEAEYNFTVTENADLMACFTPNSTFETGIQATEVDQENLIYQLVAGSDEIEVVTDADVKMVYVFAADGTLVAKSAAKKVSVGGAVEGTYIVKVVTAAGDGSKKIVLK